MSLVDETSVVSFSSCTFSVTSSSGQNGEYLYISALDGETTAVRCGWEAGWTFDTLSTDEERYWIEEISPTTTRTALPNPMLHFVYPPLSDTTATIIYAGPDGGDITTCGWETLPCMSVYTAVTRAAEAERFVTVSLLTSTHSPDTTSIVVNKALTITGAELDSNHALTTTKQVSSSLSPLFSINAAVTLSKLKFLWSGSSTPLTSSLIKADSDTSALTLEGVEFNGIFISSHPLISVDDTASKLTLTQAGSSLNCIFTEVSRSSGSGAVLQLSVGEGESLTLSYAVFHLCTSTGDGGINSAVEISVTGVPSQLTLTSITTDTIDYDDTSHPYPYTIHFSTDVAASTFLEPRLPTPPITDTLSDTLSHLSFIYLYQLL